LFFTNLIIANDPASYGFYSWFLAGQFAFYLLAFFGWLMVRLEKPAGFLSIPFYFVFMNYCQLKGLVHYLKGKQTVLWEKSLRQVVNTK